MNRPEIDWRDVALQRNMIIRQVGVDAMTLLASKGIRPVEQASATAEDGVWYMGPDGWRQHGSDVFHRYDQREPLAEEPIVIDLRKLMLGLPLGLLFFVIGWVALVIGGR